MFYSDLFEPVKVCSTFEVPVIDAELHGCVFLMSPDWLQYHTGKWFHAAGVRNMYVTSSVNQCCFVYMWYWFGEFFWSQQRWKWQWNRRAS